MENLRARMLTPIVSCTGILAVGAVFALAGLDEWYNPAQRPVTGKAGPLYLFSEALWGPKGPAYVYWGLSSMFFVFGLALCVVLVRQGAKRRAYQRLVRRNAH